jgi:hypothetical protein
MPSPEPQPPFKPSHQGIEVLCERLQRMGVSMSEAAARSLLEAVLAVEGPRLDALSRGTIQASLEAIRNATEAALVILTGAAPGAIRRDYALSFPPPPPPPAADPVSASGSRRRAPAPRPVASRAPVEQPPAPPPPLRRQPRQEPDTGSDNQEPRPVFKPRRGR